MLVVKDPPPKKKNDCVIVVKVDQVEMNLFIVILTTYTKTLLLLDLLHAKVTKCNGHSLVLHPLICIKVARYIE